MSLLLADAETYSELDLTLVGSRRYVEHHSTRPILWSLRDPDWSDSLVFEGDLWDILADLKSTNRISWTKNEPLTLVHWSRFDRELHQYGVDREEVWDSESEPGCTLGPNNTQWVDLAQASIINGGPGGLDQAAKFWSQSELKHKGKHLINLFCTPNSEGEKPNPADDPVRWEEFRAYARQDTNAMVGILEMLDYLIDTDQGESLADHWPYLRMVDRMNERGAPVDRASAIAGNDALYDLSSKVKPKVEKKYGFKLGNPKKVAAFLGLENAQKDTIEENLGSFDKKQAEVAKAYLLTSGAASKKLVPIVRMSTEDDWRVYNAFVYHGAWTRRLTSIGIQLQNLVHEPCSEIFFQKLMDGTYKGKIFDDVRRNIRGFIKAAEGKTLCVADYNAIECRYSAWLAGEQWLIDAFEQGADPYLIMASAIYGEDITDKKDPRRQFGKTVELGAQYGLGDKGLWLQCQAKGIDVSRDLCKRTIRVYREMHACIERAWEARTEALWELVRGAAGQCIELDRGTKYTRTERSIQVTRPSGFSSYLWLPQIRDGKWPDGGHKSEVSFLGRGKGGVMVRQSTYGGRAFQGEVQGGAADYMLEGMLAAEERGYYPVMSVHDEGVFEIEDDGLDYHEDLEETLCVDLPWSRGLPVAAEGYQQPRFTKG